MTKQNTDSDHQSPDSNDQVLRKSVEQALNNYFVHLDGQTATDIYQMVLAEVELPLFTSIMNYTQGNQTKAAKLLGLNRGTLRKKLQHYKLIQSVDN